MNLSAEESQRFYKLFFHLLEFTNNKYQINPGLKKLALSGNENSDQITPIRNKLWEDNSILEEFSATNPFLFSKADIAVINSWKKHRIADSFILLKYMKDHSIIIGHDHAFGIVGLQLPLTELIPPFYLPVKFDTVLLPFGSKIIYDSLIFSYPMTYSNNAKNNLLKQFYEYKNKSGIITSLPFR